MPSKVTFDGINKIIYVNLDVIALDIRTDVYSSWIDWIVVGDNIKFLPAIRVTGLDQIGAGTYTGDIYFLINGWKLSVNLLQVKVTGVLYSDDYATAFYTPSLAAQYPVTVSALVNTVSTGAGGGGATAVQIRQEIDNNSTKLSSIQIKVNTLDNGPSAAAIATQVRTELNTELTHLSTLSNNPGLTSPQATMLLEMYVLLGLDPTKPLVVTNTSRTAGDLYQNISTSANETIVSRP